MHLLCSAVPISVSMGSCPYLGLRLCWLAGLSSFRLCACLSVCLSVCLLVCLPDATYGFDREAFCVTRLPAWLSVCLPVSRLPFCLLVCLPVFLSVRLPSCLLVLLFVCLSVCLCVCLPACLSALLLACLAGRLFFEVRNLLIECYA